MVDDPRRTEPEPVFADDLLVEAARAGHLEAGADDPLAALLAGLYDRAAGRCSCGSRREECPARTAGCD
ncbi:hypothetical protein GCM10017691_12180 [Pseudonocardia petroleophila]|uniref:Uncharacterized protein n=1 Tax=Pseudonocardia petroleophila TaxID=37331 RepID=A0A7G7MIN9_9PSEU|nr:hypothetical protein [Pseudonocardia petroleophila]QNG52650.1 hypothetical protein H6H00_00770 [Pseudonocardia petroleophila]